MSIASARRVVGWILDDRRHFVDILEGDQWVVMHPLSCRMTEGSLLACVVTEKVARAWRPDDGRWQVDHAERRDMGYNAITGEPRFTDLDWKLVDKDFDPIISRLDLILEHLDRAEDEPDYKNACAKLADMGQKLVGFDDTHVMGDQILKVLGPDVLNVVGKDARCDPSAGTHVSPHKGCVLR